MRSPVPVGINWRSGGSPACVVSVVGFAVEGVLEDLGARGEPHTVQSRAVGALSLPQNGQTED
jgi:hypothetical protein